MASSAPDLTSRLLRHERLIVAAGVAALLLLSWGYIVTGAGMGGPMGGMGSPPLGPLIVMWWLMMVAMMLPSAAPALLLYAQVRQIRSRDVDIAATWVFLAGYLAVWLLFSVAAAIAQSLLTGPSMALSSSVAQGAVLVAAGAYQLSPLKGICIGLCRSPARFISRYWRSGWKGAFGLGIRHGIYCLGCCWMLMALLFVGGIMNVTWVVGLTLIVAIEKLAPRGDLFGKVAGMALFAWGVVILAR
jgi:predicted metal-binding membrane protein